jgi:cytochrome b561
MVLLPVTGYLGSAFTRYPVLFFGHALPRWSPDWPAAKELMSGLHEVLVWVFMALLVLHVGAALWHWLRGDAIASRMGLPVRQFPRRRH